MSFPYLIVAPDGAFTVTPLMLILMSFKARYVPGGTQTVPAWVQPSSQTLEISSCPRRESYPLPQVSIADKCVNRHTSASCSNDSCIESR